MKRSSFAELEKLRKSLLPAECHLAPDDDPGWTAWEQSEGVFGGVWSRRNVIQTKEGA